MSLLCCRGHSRALAVLGFSVLLLRANVRAGVYKKAAAPCGFVSTGLLGHGPRLIRCCSSAEASPQTTSTTPGEEHLIRCCRSAEAPPQKLSTNHRKSRFWTHSETALSPTRGFFVRCIASFQIAYGLWGQLPAWGLSSDADSRAILPGSDSFYVYDETNLLTTSTEKYLGRLLAKLETDTQVKLRVICPPIGVKDNRDSWKQFSSPVFRQMLVDQNSLVVLAEQQVGTQFRDSNLLSFIPGSNLMSRFQFKLTKYSFQREKAKYGTPEYVNGKGTDAAVRDSVRSMSASIYRMLEDVAYGGYIMSEQEVADVLRRHEG